MFVNYVEIAGKDVVDKHGRMLGRPHDFMVKMGGAYPHIAAVILSRGVFKKRFATLPWSHIKRVDGRIHLGVSEETLIFRPGYDSEELTSVKKSILDQQVVDTFNRKVVRVNDIHLLRVERDLRIAHVEVGFRSLIRRLGWERAIDHMIRFFHPRSRYLTKRQFISWKFVQPLEVNRRRGTIQLDVPYEELAAIPPADFSEIMDELDPPERVALFRSLDFDTQVDLLNELSVEMQKDLIQEVDAPTAIKFMEKMEPDEVADLLGELSKAEAGKVLAMMSPARSRKIHALLKYESDSAGGLMTTDFISLSPDMSVAEAIEKIKTTKLDTEMVYYTYVVDENGKLEGMVTFKKLLTSPAAKKIKEVMVKRTISVLAETDAKEVAYLMDKYDFLAVPVVDKEKIVRGIITIDDILELVIDETWGEKRGLL